MSLLIFLVTILRQERHHLCIIGFRDIGVLLAILFRHKTDNS